MVTGLPLGVALLGSDLAAATRLGHISIPCASDNCEFGNVPIRPRRVNCSGGFGRVKSTVGRGPTIAALYA